MAASIAPIAPKVAEAYSRDGLDPASAGFQFDACGPRVYFEFAGTDDGGDADWSADTREKVREAFRTWEEVVDRNGNPVVNIQPGSAGDSPLIKVRLKRFDPPVTGGGFGSCPARIINLNVQLADFPQRLKGVATHEMGHVLGLAHTGRQDSIMDDDDPPTMVDTGCYEDEQETDVQRSKASLTHDDHAGLTHRQGGGNPMHANSSFETELNQDGGGIPQWNLKPRKHIDHSRPSGGAEGNRYLMFRGTKKLKAPDPRVFQDVLVFRSGLHDAAVQVRRGAGTYGNVFLLAWRRPYVEENNYCNVVPNGQWRRTAEERISPDQEWALYETGDHGPFGDFMGLRIVLRNDLREDLADGTTIRAAVDADDLRIRPR